MREEGDPERADRYSTRDPSRSRRHVPRTEGLRLRSAREERRTAAPTPGPHVGKLTHRNAW